MSEFLDNLDTLNRIISDLRTELAAERKSSSAWYAGQLEADIRKLREALDMAVALLPEHRREYFDAVLAETRGDRD